eukprot:GAHX01001177.1.p1 GENE.GAHX01001177.1~~GAHX01001177.1.p1  ORF type:complete len:472 (-),score=99.70 GAHX01001177.1:35-1450(-)
MGKFKNLKIEMLEKVQFKEGTADLIIECYIMLYSFKDNRWMKVCDANEIKLLKVVSSSSHFLSIRTLNRTNKQFDFELNSKYDYKIYSKFFHRLRTDDNDVFGLLFLSGDDNEIPHQFYKFITEIVIEGKLQVPPVDTVHPKNPTCIGDTIHKVRNEKQTPKKESKIEPISPPKKKDRSKSKLSFLNFFRRGKTGSMTTPKYNAPEPKAHKETLSYTELHVEFDTKTKRLIGLPEEWERILETRFSMPYKYLELVKVSPYKEKIPKILVKLREQMTKNNGLDKTGIFRVPGGKTRVDEVMKEINRGDFSCDDTFVMAHIFKKFYREMPKSVLNQKCLNMFLDKVRNDNRDYTLAKIGRRSINDGIGEIYKKPVSIVKQNAENRERTKFTKDIIANINEPELSMYMFLLDFCKEVVDREELNKMSAENLAIVLSPNIFCVKKAMTQLDLIKVTTEVKQFLHNCIRMKLDGEL